MSKNIKLTSRRLRSIIESIVKEEQGSKGLVTVNFSVIVDAEDLVAERGAREATNLIEQEIMEYLGEVADVLFENVSEIDGIPVAVKSVEPMMLGLNIF